jgi:hypothetical protein
MKSAAPGGLKVGKRAKLESPDMAFSPDDAQTFATKNLPNSLGNKL